MCKLITVFVKVIYCGFLYNKKLMATIIGLKIKTIPPNASIKHTLSWATIFSTLPKVFVISIVSILHKVRQIAFTA
jgi:hypothetical protein